MAIHFRSVYIGPNIHLPVPALRWSFAESASQSWQSPVATLEFVAPLFDALPTLRMRLERALPTAKLRARPGSAEGPAAIELVMYFCMALQAAAGHPARLAKLTPGDGGLDVVCEVKEPVLGLIAMETAGRLMAALLGPRAEAAAAIAAAMERFRAEVARECLDPTTRALVQAAEARGIPWFRLGQSSIVQLGYGRFTRRLIGSVPDGQGWIAATQIASDRAALHKVLDDLALPVPRQEVVASADEAVAAAGRLRPPLVLRPLHTGQGGGTRVFPRDDAAALREAFAQDFSAGRPAVVEKFLQGDLHRLLVVDGSLVAAARRPRDGGRPEDVTDRLHPEVSAVAECAAQAVGLQVAGIDFITRDIALSPSETGGIGGVDPAPSLLPHLLATAPDGGTARRDVVTPILDLLYPPQQDHRVPIATVTGTNGKTTTSTMLARILQQAGRHVGLVSTIGVQVDGETIRKGDLAGSRGFNMVAHNPKVDAIVAEVARGSLIRRGLGFRRCDVGAVTNVTTDHLGELGIETLEEMARVKEVVAQAVAGTLVLNADDARCLAMAGRARARRVCLVTLEDDCPELDAHLATGGCGARLRKRDGEEYLTLCGPQGETDIIAVTKMPAAFGGLARHNLQNGLFAAALAEGLGIDAATIRAALAQFHCDRKTVPGRLNVFDGHPFKVILDYGHNPGGYKVIGPMVTAMAAGKGRRICVFTSPADRNDAHLAEIAEVAAPFFDHFICRQGLRQNREPGAVPDKLRDALIANGVAAERIATSGDPEEAVLTGLGMARAGDIVYVMSTPNPDGSFWQLIENFGSNAAAEGTKT